jgi:hypothetical protein
MQATAPQAAVYRPETAVVAVGTAGNESSTSAISWPSSAALCRRGDGTDIGALGQDLGFAAVSPWSNSGASATTMTIAGAIWLLLMSAIASAIGGYLAGRLRTVGSTFTATRFSFAIPRMDFSLGRLGQ